MERDILQKIQADRQKAAAEAQGQEREQPFDLKTASPLDLQGMIGNKATSQLLAPGGNGPVVQTKMTVTDANDVHEKEADAVAEKIVSGAQADSVQREGPEDEMALKRIQRMGDDASLSDDDLAQPQRVQRMDEDEMALKRIQREEMPEDEMALKRIQREEMPEDEMALKRIQRDATDMSKSFDVGGEIEDQIKSTGGGQALDGGIQTKMEAGTGHDFSNVKVHTDSSADALSESLGARAFTTGTDIFFKQGEYNPGSTEGDKLIAHEATHVIQQGGTQMKREDD